MYTRIFCQVKMVCLLYTQIVCVECKVFESPSQAKSPWMRLASLSQRLGLISRPKSPWLSIGFRVDLGTKDSTWLVLNRVADQQRQQVNLNKTKPKVNLN